MLLKALFNAKDLLLLRFMDNLAIINHNAMSTLKLLVLLGK